MRYLHNNPFSVVELLVNVRNSFITVDVMVEDGGVGVLPLVGVEGGVSVVDTKQVVRDRDTAHFGVVVKEAVSAVTL